jgi:hypothetical protein
MILPVSHLVLAELLLFMSFAGSAADIVLVVTARVADLAVLKLMFGALIRAAERWRSVKVTEFERRQVAAVRKDLDQEIRGRGRPQNKAIKG